jgi:hypothetical protein
MRNSLRLLSQLTLLTAVAAGLLVPEAVAGSITVQFSGNVQGKTTNASYPANVMFNDAIVNSSFSYNSAQAPPATNGIYNFTGTGQTFALFVDTPVPVGEYTATTWGDDRLTGGTYSIVMTKAVSASTTTTTMTVNLQTAGGSADSKTGASVSLVFKSTTYTGGLALPTTATGSTSTSMNTFLNTAASLTWDPGGPPALGFYSNNLGNFILNGESVPEPSSLVLAGVALALTSGGYLIRRRRAVRVSQIG